MGPGHGGDPKAWRPSGIDEPAGEGHCHLRSTKVVLGGTSVCPSPKSYDPSSLSSGPPHTVHVVVQSPLVEHAPAHPPAVELPSRSGQAHSGPQYRPQRPPKALRPEG